jgi:hypothetical protein
MLNSFRKKNHKFSETRQPKRRQTRQDSVSENSLLCMNTIDFFKVLFILLNSGIFIDRCKY